jgi:hypothetical protein
LVSLPKGGQGKVQDPACKMRGMAQVGECVSSKCEALNSIPSTERERERERERDSRNKTTKQSAQCWVLFRIRIKMLPSKFLE